MLANPPKAVPWFGDGGDPLLPENQGKEIKPLLRMFDPYQSYDLLVFEAISRHSPANKINFTHLADPFAFDSRFGFKGVLVERFTPFDDFPWAEIYTDYLKGIADTFLKLGSNWEFESITIETPEFIEVEVTDLEAPTFILLTWFEKDQDNSLIRRAKKIESSRDKLFFQLNLIESSITPYSLVVSGKEANKVIQEINKQTPYLLFNNIDDWRGIAEENFLPTKAINHSTEKDPFRREELFFNSYTDKLDSERVFQSTNYYPIKSEDSFVVSDSKNFASFSTRFPFGGFPADYASLRALYVFANRDLLLTLSRLGVPNPEQYFVKAQNSLYSPSFLPTAVILVGGYLTPKTVDGGVDDEIHEFLDKDAVGGIRLEEAKVVVGLTPGVLLPEWIVKTSVIGREKLEPCIKQDFETEKFYSTNRELLNYKQETTKRVSWLEEFDLTEEDYNFCEIIRANNGGRTQLSNTRPVYLYDFRDSYRINKSGKENIPLVIDNTKIKIDREDLAVSFVVTRDKENSETEGRVETKYKNVELQKCKDIQTFRLKHQTTGTRRNKIRWNHAYSSGVNEIVDKRSPQLINEIDKFWWEYDPVENDLINPMPDSLRIKEIHAALDADRYATYQLNDKEYGRLANLGFYIESIGRLLGINVMPDRSRYDPPPLEQIKPDDQGNVQIEDPYRFKDWGEGFEVPGKERVENDDFEDYGVQYNALAYQIFSKSFREDPDTGEMTILDRSGYFLVHNFPQLIEMILTDLNQAISWEDLGASKQNIEKQIRTFYKKQFINEYDADEDNSFGDEDDEDREERLFPKEVKTEGLLELLAAHLAIEYGRSGFQDYPVITPKTLSEQENEDKYNPDDSGFDEKFDTKHQNYAQFYSWFLEQFDGLIGQFPIKIKIEDNDLIKTGSQEIEITLPNLAETLAELTGKSLTNEAYIQALLTSSLKNLGETGSTRSLGIRNNAILNAILEYLGFDVDQAIEQVDFTFNPIDTISAEGQEGDESLETALNPKQIDLEVIKNIDSKTLEDKLEILIESARINKAQNFRTLNLAGDDPKRNLIDLLTKGADFLAQNGVITDALGKQLNNKVSFDDWIDEVETEFQQPGADTAYGRDYKRRPKIKDNSHRLDNST